MNFFRRFQKTTTAAARNAAVPDGERVYAIGDIHGRDDLFAQLIDAIDADNSARGPARTTLILLGDLVDRGPESKAVVERAIALRGRFDRVRHLIGNHEECFMEALTGDVSRVRYFMRIGGDATVRSYWGDDAAYRDASFDDVAAGLPSRVPAAHLTFFERAEDRIVIGDYAFVHAGVRPGVPIDAQAISDLRWIRGEFLDDPRDHGAVIVHGHTIAAVVEDCGNRIGIDTGAYQSGVLTAIGLEKGERWFLDTAD